MKTSDWNPGLYLQYGRERTQPSIDLVARIAIDGHPGRIIDVGCGPGNSSQILRTRWPSAAIVGLDSSARMIEQARRDFPDGEWVLDDASTYEPNGAFDIVFSNAAIQWMSDHRRLIGRFAGWLSDGGILAVQVPMFSQMPVAQAVEHVVSSARWSGRLAGAGETLTRHDRGFYYDLLAEKFGEIDMWETDYLHVLASHESIVEWIRSTALKPYLDCLSEAADRRDLEGEILVEVARRYPKQQNGKVLYPFKRLFFIARR